MPLVTLAVFLSLVAVASRRPAETVIAQRQVATSSPSDRPPPLKLRLAKGGRAVRSVLIEYCWSDGDGDGGGGCGEASLAGPPPTFRAPVGARVIIDTRRPATKLAVHVGGRAVRTKQLTDTRWRIRAPRRSGLTDLDTTYANGSTSEALVQLKALARR